MNQPGKNPRNPSEPVANFTEGAAECPCCTFPLYTLEYVFNAETGEVRTNVLYCGTSCDLFYDTEAAMWRDKVTWTPWNGVGLADDG